MLVLEEKAGLAHMISKLPWWASSCKIHQIGGWWAKMMQTYEIPWKPTKVCAPATLSNRLHVLRRFGNRADHAYERVMNPITSLEKVQIADAAYTVALVVATLCKYYGVSPRSKL
jgi:hypothetical protein